MPMPATISTNMAAKMATAWRIARTMRPNMKTCATGISRIESTSRKFVSPFGFSNGTAEFESKKPPPLVPSCLIAIWEAAGPRVIVWCAPSSVVAVA